MIFSYLFLIFSLTRDFFFPPLIFRLKTFINYIYFFDIANHKQNMFLFSIAHAIAAASIL